jgi:glutaredoxin
MNELELYYLPTCPYCLKVLNFIEKNGILIELRCTTEPGNREKLLEVGKKNQVPCLFIAGQPMYESEDIIAYLRKRFVA